MIYFSQNFCRRKSNHCKSLPRSVHHPTPLSQKTTSSLWIFVVKKTPFFRIERSAKAPQDVGAQLWICGFVCWTCENFDGICCQACCFWMVSQWLLRMGALYLMVIHWLWNKHLRRLGPGFRGFGGCRCVLNEQWFVGVKKHMITHEFLMKLVWRIVILHELSRIWYVRA